MQLSIKSENEHLGIVFSKRAKSLLGLVHAYFGPAPSPLGKIEMQKN